MALSVVVFPAPFAPNNVVIEPSATASDTPFKTRMTAAGAAAAELGGMPGRALFPTSPRAAESVGAQSLAFLSSPIRPAMPYYGIPHERETAPWRLVIFLRRLASNGQCGRSPAAVLVIESGTAAREDYFMLDGTYVNSKVAIPIMIVPSGATVLKTVAMAAPATIHWDDAADPSAIWGVDQVDVEENTTTRQLSIIANVVGGGEKTDMPRIAYHITIFIQGRKYDADPQLLLELENA